MNIKEGVFYNSDKTELLYFVYTENKWNNLVTLNLADSDNIILKKIANRAAQNCSSLQRLVLGENILTIGEMAFAGCEDLQIVKYASKAEWHKAELNNCFAELKEGKTISVQYQAFKDCSKLHTVIFPRIAEDSCISIGSEVFSSCYELRTVILLGNGTIKINESAFSGCDKQRLVFLVSKDSCTERFVLENGYRCINVQ